MTEAADTISGTRNATMIWVGVTTGGDSGDVEISAGGVTIFGPVNMGPGDFTPLPCSVGTPPLEDLTIESAPSGVRVTVFHRP